VQGDADVQALLGEGREATRVCLRAKAGRRGQRGEGAAGVVLDDLRDALVLRLRRSRHRAEVAESHCR
jgi:hypothetical protein